MAATRIGIAVVLHGNHVLVGQRSQDSVLAGHHEFPGGKCQINESAEACAVRECLEETGLSVKVVGLLDHRQFTYDHGTVDLSFFECELNRYQEPTPPFTWIELAQLDGCSFPEGNRPLLQILKQRLEAST